jgi:hypothetical protein
MGNHGIFELASGHKIAPSDYVDECDSCVGIICSFIGGGY